MWSAGPVRVYFGHFAGVVGGTVRVFCFSGSVLAGTVQLKWWGVLYLTFHFLQFAVSSLGGWICAVGILLFIFYGICSGVLRFCFLFFYIPVVDC